MKINKRILKILILPAFLLFFLSCEYDSPTSVWDEVEKRDKILIGIDGIDPAEAGAAGVLTINGVNFSTIPEENTVFIDGVKCVVMSSSESAISIYRPNVVGDSTRITVSTAHSTNVAYFFPYKMDPIIEEFGSFATENDFRALTIDQNENVYVAMGDNNVLRLNPDGSRDINYLGTTPGNLWTDMKIGSDGYVYMARSNQQIYRLSTTETNPTAQEYVNLESRSRRIQTIDFDENDNMFGGGKAGGLFIIRPGGAWEELGLYVDYNINSVRVYSGYLYVTAAYRGTAPVEIEVGIWQHQILDQNGSLGDGSLVLDWEASPYPQANMLDITFSESGILYIATGYNVDEDYPTSIIKYNRGTGNYDYLFYGLIEPDAGPFQWGNSTYIYVIINRLTSVAQGGRFLRINTGELGAPYNGR